MTEMIVGEGEMVEVLQGSPPALMDTAMASALVRAEIDTQVATARQYPRSIKSAISNILTLATLDEETATECIYALKRGGKPIRGPSIRLAEIIASQWGNCRDSAMVVSVDRANKMIVAEGMFHDLETNRGTRSSVQRRISGTNGKIFSDDMIVVTGNAACAIARRNAILAGVPKGVWRRAVEAAEQIIRGDAKTLVERRDGAINALAHFNLSPEQIFKIMEVQGIDDLNLDDIATLRVIYTSLKNGEQTVEELLRGVEPEKSARAPVTAKITAPSAFADTVPSATPDASPAQPVDPPKTAAQPEVKPIEPVAEGPLSAGTASDEPDDAMIVANDIIKRLKASAGNPEALKRIVEESQQEFEGLPEAQRKRVQQVHDEASKAKRKAA